MPRVGFTSAEIVDATTTGKALIVATDQQAARNAIGFDDNDTTTVDVGNQQIPTVDIYVVADTTVLFKSANWPTSGSATTGTTGFDAVSLFTHSGKNLVSTTAADDSTARFISSAAFIAEDYVWQTWFEQMLVTDLSALNGDANNVTARRWEGSLGGSPRAWVLQKMHNYAANWIYASNFGGTAGAAKSYTDSNNQPGGKWQRHDLVVNKDSSGTNYYRYYIDGILTSSNDDDFSTYGIVRSDLKFSNQLGTKTMIRDVTVRNRLPTESELRAIQTSPWTKIGVIDLGAKIQPTLTPSDSTKVTVAHYATGGSNPFQTFYQITGSCTLTGIDVGEPKYTDGYTQIVFPMLYIPSGTFECRINSGLITITCTGGNIAVNGTNYGTYTVAARFSLVVQVALDNTENIYLIRHRLDSITTSSTETVAGPVSVTLTAIDDIVMDFTYSADTIEYDGCWLMPTHIITGVDSLLSTDVGTVSPDYRGHNFYARYMYGGALGNQFHGYFDPYFETWDLRQGYRIPCFISYSESGIAKETWTDHVLDKLTNVGRGIEIHNFEGGTNDIFLCPGTNSQAVTLAQLKADTNSLIAWAELSGNKVWMTTLISRSLAAHWASGSQADVDERTQVAIDYNIWLRTLSSPTLTLSDIDLAASVSDQESWIDLSNPPHPTIASSRLFCHAAIETRRQT